MPQQQASKRELEPEQAQGQQPPLEHWVRELELAQESVGVGAGTGCVTTATGPELSELEQE